MGEMILKVVQPLILEIKKEAKTEGIEEGIEKGMKKGMEKGMEKGKILGAVEILRSFNSNDETKKIIMEKYHLTENDAEKYLNSNGQG